MFALLGSKYIINPMDPNLAIAAPAVFPQSGDNSPKSINRIIMY